MPQSHALPRWQQLAETLTRDIAAGRLEDGARLPPERALAERHGVAVGTLRKALAALEERGLLSRVQGSGNYVRRPDRPKGVYAFFRLERPEGGGLPTADLIELARAVPPSGLVPFDGLPHRIRRLRRLDGEPVAVEEIWLDARLAPRLVPEDLSESLYLAYARRLGLSITRAEDRIGSGRMPDWAGEAAPKPPGAACLLVTRLARTQEGVLAEVSRTWFDSDKCRYINRMDG